MQTCVFCNQIDNDVVHVGTCGSKCVVYAHTACFEGRMFTALYRKKNVTRCNGDAEICPHMDCSAKFKPRGPKTIQNSLQVSMVTCGSVEDDDRVHDDTMCSFPTRNGKLCFRKACEFGACRIHRELGFAKKMMEEKLKWNEKQSNVVLDKSTTEVVQPKALPKSCKAISVQTSSVLNTISTQTTHFTKDTASQCNLLGEMEDLKAENALMKSTIQKMRQIQSEMSTAYSQCKADNAFMKHTMERMKDKNREILSAYSCRVSSMEKEFKEKAVQEVMQALKNV